MNGRWQQRISIAQLLVGLEMFGGCIFLLS